MSYIRINYIRIDRLITSTMLLLRMLHQNKIHNLIVLNNKDKSRPWADLMLKRQI